jgi:hypothetical protein
MTQRRLETHVPLLRKEQDSINLLDNNQSEKEKELEIQEASSSSTKEVMQLSKE